MNSYDRTIELIFSISSTFYNIHTDFCRTRAEDRGYECIENFIDAVGIKSVTHEVSKDEDTFKIEILVTVIVDNHYINKLKLTNSGDYRVFKILYLSGMPLNMGNL